MSGFFKKTILISPILALVVISQSNFAFGQTISSNVDIIVEPTSYIPQFYKGRPFFTSQGTMRIVAIPNVVINGSKVSSKNLTFRWTKDDVALSSIINTGNDSMVVSGGIPIRDINIVLRVTDSSGNIVASGSKTISANNPRVIFYENSPLYGLLLNRAVGSYSLGNREELNILAKPYFFNIESQDSDDIEYKWSVNGNPVSLSGKKNELLFKQVDTAGVAEVSLDVNNLARIFQFTKSSFNVSFGQ